MKYLWNKDTNRETDKKIIRFLISCLEPNIPEKFIDQYIDQGVEAGVYKIYSTGAHRFRTKVIGGHSTIKILPNLDHNRVNVTLELAARTFELSLVEDF